MQLLFVVNNPASWPISIANVQVVSSRTYLTDPAYNRMRSVRVINLCRSYSYQSLGYYVSLLAEARGHRPQPDLITLQDLKSVTLARSQTDDFDDLIQRSLKTIKSDAFELSIYFGKTLAKRDRQLGVRLYNAFRCPLLRAYFVRKKHKWLLQSIRAIPASEIPPAHQDDVIAAAEEYVVRRGITGTAHKKPKYYLAVLVDPDEAQPPSDEGFMNRFRRAARAADMAIELITRDDYGYIAEFDALFIRTTTNVNHYTYRFARRAAAEGLAVIDDPVSILRCTNKVYLTERLQLNHIAVPTTVIVHRDNIDQAIAQLGLPCVLKQPDGSFSTGVSRAGTEAEFREKAKALLENSELIIAQRFMPTEFDWRIGMLDGEPFYACKYFMARSHWQVQHRNTKGKLVYGQSHAMPIDEVPANVIKTAVKASRLMGTGLYGVDLKEVDQKVYVIEVNDNPSIESNCEDGVLKDQLYERLVQSFINRIEALDHHAGRKPHGAESSSV